MAVEALPDGKAEGLTRKAVEMALEGDTTALRLCLERIAPPRKDAPLTVALPKVETARDAAAAPGTVVEAFRRTLEMAELETRSAAFEFGAAGRPKRGAA